MNTRQEDTHSAIAAQAEYWKTNHWDIGQIGFHSENIHSALQNNLDHLTCGRSCLKIFLPLSGKSRDATYLVNQGHSVVCIEFVQQPILEFFEESNMDYTIEPLSTIDGFLYKALDGRIKIYCCDFFHVSRELIGAVDGVWDRAAYIALDKQHRKRYAELIVTLLAPDAKYLLVTLEFEGNKYIEPPFLVPDIEIEENFGSTCLVKQLMSEPSKSSYLTTPIAPDVFYEKLHLLTFKG